MTGMIRGLVKRIRPTDDRAQAEKEISRFRQEFVKTQLEFGDTCEFYVVGNTLKMFFQVSVSPHKHAPRQLDFRERNRREGSIHYPLFIVASYTNHLYDLFDSFPLINSSSCTRIQAIMLSLQSLSLIPRLGVCHTSGPLIITTSMCFVIHTCCPCRVFLFTCRELRLPSLSVHFCAVHCSSCTWMPRRSAQTSTLVFTPVLLRCFTNFPVACLPRFLT